MFGQQRLDVAGKINRGGRRRFRGFARRRVGPGNASGASAVSNPTTSNDRHENKVTIGRTRPQGREQAGNPMSYTVNQFSPGLH